MSGWVRSRLEDNCMPFPFGILCWLEDSNLFRDTEEIHHGSEPEDWVCRAHDNTMEFCARVGIPILRGTWRKR